ncbi:rhodanese-like domain-containing protein [Amycolatopsis albispora]|uniref:Sulfurtransferase n=1 Tax=Amycolatopsis albispora TaxID=1804986 RepID=A0A344L6S2_9PSEU|nr:rhodanese-like domain-containing protein [Amycolatopsis albispora]AXB43746.1 sulfurtransferase [Amycolatopsis albispora]
MTITSSDAVSYFATQLRFRTDAADVHAALESGTPGFTLLDSRGDVAWAQGRIPGALHLPTAEIARRGLDLLDPTLPVVTYCWGPGCDGATKAALAVAKLGFHVKEMIGGIEYWIREGFGVETDDGIVRRPADPLTSPTAGVTCDC